MFRSITLIAIIVVVGLPATAAAQRTTALRTGGGGSPHVRTEWTIDGASITIEYGRPFLKGRSEALMMPPGDVWRTGADAATVMTANRPLRFGAVSLPAGTHTINTLPGPQQWQLLLGSLEKPGQWGIPYLKPLELGRVPLTLAQTPSPVEQLTIAVDDTPAGATLRIEWGTKRLTVPFTIGVPAP